MATYDFDAPVERRGTDSVKFDCAVRFGRPEDALPLWVADMDFPAPPAVLEALSARVRHGVFGYTIAGDGYRAAVTGWLRDRHAWDIRPEWIVAIPGVVYGLSTAVRAFTEPGDAVVIQPPVYYPFGEVIRDNGRVVAQAHLVYGEDGRYTIDFEALEQAFEETGAKLFLLCSPHNPVGRVWREDELRRLGEICLAHDVIVASDEIHMDFVRPGHTHIPFASLSHELAERTVAFTSASKTFNLAGLQAANAIIANDALRERFARAVRVSACNEPNVLGLVANEAAYRHGAEWLDELRKYLEGNWSFLRDFLRQRIPALTLVEAEGTYLAWIDCRKLGLDDHALKRFMLDEAKLWLDQGDMFGPEGGGFVRINIATQRATLERALVQLEHAVASLR